MSQGLFRRLLSDRERTLRVSGSLIALGLLFEALTLYFNHPFSFMGFIFLTGTLVVVGMLLFVGTIIPAFGGNK